MSDGSFPWDQRGFREASLILRLSRRVLKFQDRTGFTSSLPAVQGLLQQPREGLVLCTQTVVQRVMPHAVHRPRIGSMAQEQFSHLGTAFLTGQDQSRSVGWDKSEHRLSRWNPGVLVAEIPLTGSAVTQCGQENHRPTRANDKALGETRTFQMSLLGAAASESKGPIGRAPFSSAVCIKFFIGKKGFHCLEDGNLKTSELN